MRSSSLPAFDSSFLRPVLISIFFLFSMVLVCAQVPEQSPTATAANSESAPPANTAGDVQVRIQRARALAAAHQLQTAANELEAVRRIAQDDVVRNITSVMLMGIYLEDGNYVRAQVLLDEDFRARASGRDAALRTYFAIAGQAINGARSHLARYRSFGINISEPDGLPAEANSDLDRLRGLLERLTAQAKEIIAERKAYDSLALLEDVVGVRLSMARDSSDRSTWEAEYAAAREGLASAQTQIASLIVPALSGAQATTATPTTKEPPPAAKEPASSTPAPATQSVEATSSVPVPSSTATGQAENKDAENTTVSTGSLNARASKTVIPTYPQLAKTAGITGIVRVYVVVDETGKVAQITSSEGPMLLRGSAEEAARGWRFPPTAVNGKAVKLSGFIEFSFTR